MPDPEREVHRMHEAIEAWFRGETTDFDRLATVLAEEFRIVSPDGTTTDRETLVERLRASEGIHADMDPAFAIDVRNVERRPAGEGWHLVTYEEHQRVDGDWQARTSSALFREREDAPAGVEWVHLHETRLPDWGD